MELTDYAAATIPYEQRTYALPGEVAAVPPGSPYERGINRLIVAHTSRENLAGQSGWMRFSLQQASAHGLVLHLDSYGPGRGSYAKGGIVAYLMDVSRAGVNAYRQGDGLSTEELLDRLSAAQVAAANARWRRAERLPNPQLDPARPTVPAGTQPMLLEAGGVTEIDPAQAERMRAYGQDPTRFLVLAQFPLEHARMADDFSERLFTPEFPVGAWPYGPGEGVYPQGGSALVLERATQSLAFAVGRLAADLSGDGNRLATDSSFSATFTRRLSAQTEKCVLAAMLSSDWERRQCIMAMADPRPLPTVRDLLDAQERESVLLDTGGVQIVAALEGVDGGLRVFARAGGDPQAAPLPGSSAREHPHDRWLREKVEALGEVIQQGRHDGSILSHALPANPYLLGSEAGKPLSQAASIL